MKIFVAYKYTNADLKTLELAQKSILRDLDELGYETFCFSKNIENWGTYFPKRREIIPIALQNLDECDVLLLLVTTAERSTGMGIEAGYAKAQGKKIFLCKKSALKEDYFESLADKVIEFTGEFPSKKDLQMLLQ